MYVVLCHSESIREEASAVSIMFGVLDCRTIQGLSVANRAWKSKRKKIAYIIIYDMYLLKIMSFIKLVHYLWTWHKKWIPQNRMSSNSGICKCLPPICVRIAHCHLEVENWRVHNFVQHRTNCGLVYSQNLNQNQLKNINTEW